MITVNSAKVTWEEVSGEFDAYTVDISPTRGGAKADPSTVPRGTNTTSLQNLSPGGYYTITIRTKIGSKTSSPSVRMFQTRELDLVEAESIRVTMITANSATVSWKEVSGEMNAYTVDISPTRGGAKADPSTVPRGTNTTSLQNLSPGRYYTITIRTKIGSKLSSASISIFQTINQGQVNSSPGQSLRLYWIFALLGCFCHLRNDTDL